jgi:hypothetical protein
MITLSLDPTKPDELELINLGMSDDSIKDMLLLGFHLYKYGMVKYLNDTMQKNIQLEVNKQVHKVEEDIKQEYEGQISKLVEENISLVKKLEEDIGNMEKAVANRYALDIDKRDMKIEHLTSLLKEAGEKHNTLQGKLEDLYKEIYKESVQQLKETIKEKELEIAMMKNTNIIKGNIGEGLLVETLRKLFHDAAVTATGKVAHVCDVHMTMANDAKYVFESKYKGNVDKKDINKFEADMKALGEGVFGGVFVSFVSKNIPGKGSMTIEVLEEIKKPVLYVAYENEQEFGLFFATHFMMFKSICEIYDQSNNDCHDTENEMQTILEEVNYFHGSMQKNKKRLEDLKKSFTKFCTEIEEDNKEIIKRLESVIKVNKSANKGTSFLCCKCNTVFASKRALNKHVRDGC